MAPSRDVASSRIIADRVCEGSPPGADRPPSRLLDRVRAAVRTRHCSVWTEKAYVHWIRRYVLFDGKRHPETLGAEEIGRFLSALAADGKVAASTQNQALSALLFLYRDVLKQELPWIDGIVRAKRPARLPVVLSHDEVAAVLAYMRGETLLMATLLYGAGLRLLECARLRVKDVDFDRRQVVVRSGKGARDRVAPLPLTIVAPLREHLRGMWRQHRKDLASVAGWVELPFALARKLPNAGREWPWQWVFPASRTYVERESRQRRRHHLHETVLQRAVRQASIEAGLAKRVTCHTVRHSVRGRRRRRCRGRSGQLVAARGIRNAGRNWIGCAGHRISLVAASLILAQNAETTDTFRCDEGV